MQSTFITYVAFSEPGAGMPIQDHRESTPYHQVERLLPSGQTVNRRRIKVCDHWNVSYSGFETAKRADIRDFFLK